VPSRSSFHLKVKLLLECESLSERSEDPALRGFRAFFESLEKPAPASWCTPAFLSSVPSVDPLVGRGRLVLYHSSLSVTDEGVRDEQRAFYEQNIPLFKILRSIIFAVSTSLKKTFK